MLPVLVFVPAGWAFVLSLKCTTALVGRRLLFGQLTIVKNERLAFVLRFVLTVTLKSVSATCVPGAGSRSSSGTRKPTLRLNLPLTFEILPGIARQTFCVAGPPLTARKSVLPFGPLIAL